MKYNGSVVVNGTKAFEDFSISGSGTKLTVSYEALDVNTTYTVSFPEGALTSVDGSKSFIADIRLNTSDFSAAKKDGDNHFGKAASSLPLNFSPFDVVALFETVGGLVQTQQNDYPHWVQASSSGDSTGEITPDHVKITNKNDKVMAYFSEVAKFLYVELDAEAASSCRVFVQEARNPDVDPKWRTMRVLEASDMPFKGFFELNTESKFVKISVPTISGAVYLNALRISDAKGDFGPDFNATGMIMVEDSEVEYFNLQGVSVKNPAPGVYIRRLGARIEKVIIQ